MRRFLLLISLILSVGVPCAVGESRRTTVEATIQTDTASTCYLFPFESEETVRYTVAITFKNASFSGICVVKRMDSVIAGSIVNEFGIRAFDFKMSENRRRVKLLNAMRPLDKCLIRKTIARDLKRLFNATETDGYVSVDGGTVIMRRPNRSYTFSKMNIPE